MKNFLLALLICFLPVAAFAGDKHPLNPSDYTVTVHVIASYARSSDYHGLSFPYHQVDVVIDGKNLELQGGTIGVLALGDYKAKVVPTPRAPKTTPSYQIFLTYEFLLPDGKTEQYTLTGFELASAGSANPKP